MLSSTSMNKKILIPSTPSMGEHSISARYGNKNILSNSKTRSIIENRSRKAAAAADAKNGRSELVVELRKTEELKTFQMSNEDFQSEREEGFIQVQEPKVSKMQLQMSGQDSTLDDLPQGGDLDHEAETEKVGHDVEAQHGELESPQSSGKRETSDRFQPDDQDSEVRQVDDDIPQSDVDKQSAGEDHLELEVEELPMSSVDTVSDASKSNLETEHSTGDQQAVDKLQGEVLVDEVSQLEGSQEIFESRPLEVTATAKFSPGQHLEAEQEPLRWEPETEEDHESKLAQEQLGLARGERDRTDKMQEQSEEAEEQLDSLKDPLRSEFSEPVVLSGDLKQAGDAEQPELKPESDTEPEYPAETVESEKTKQTAAPLGLAQDEACQSQPDTSEDFKVGTDIASRHLDHKPDDDDTSDEDGMPEPSLEQECDEDDLHESGGLVDHNQQQQHLKQPLGSSQVDLDAKTSSEEPNALVDDADSRLESSLISSDELAGQSKQPSSSELQVPPGQHPEVLDLLVPAEDEEAKELETKQPLDTSRADSTLDHKLDEELPVDEGDLRPEKAQVVQPDHEILSPDFEVGIEDEPRSDEHVRKVSSSSSSSDIPDDAKEEAGLECQDDSFPSRLETTDAFEAHEFDDNLEPGSEPETIEALDKLHDTDQAASTDHKRLDEADQATESSIREVLLGRDAEHNNDDLFENEDLKRDQCSIPKEADVIPKTDAEEPVEEHEASEAKSGDVEAAKEANIEDDWELVEAAEPQMRLDSASGKDRESSQAGSESLTDKPRTDEGVDFEVKDLKADKELSEADHSHVSEDRLSKESQSQEQEQDQRHEDFPDGHFEEVPTSGQDQIQAEIELEADNKVSSDSDLEDLAEDSVEPENDQELGDRARPKDASGAGTDEPSKGLRDLEQSEPERKSLDEDNLTEDSEEALELKADYAEKARSDSSTEDPTSGSDHEEPNLQGNEFLDQPEQKLQHHTVEVLPELKDSLQHIGDDTDAGKEQESRDKLKEAEHEEEEKHSEALSEIEERHFPARDASGAGSDQPSGGNNLPPSTEHEQSVQDSIHQEQHEPQGQGLNEPIDEGHEEEVDILAAEKVRRHSEESEESDEDEQDDFDETDFGGRPGLAGRELQHGHEGDAEHDAAAAPRTASTATDLESKGPMNAETMTKLKEITPTETEGHGQDESRHERQEGQTLTDVTLTKADAEAFDESEKPQERDLTEERGQEENVEDQAEDRRLEASPTISSSPPSGQDRLQREAQLTSGMHPLLFEYQVSSKKVSITPRLDVD